MANMFIPIKDVDVKTRKLGKCKAVLDEFMASDLPAAEFNWKETTNYASVSSVIGTFRPFISKYGYPISVSQCGDKVYFIRKK